MRAASVSFRALVLISFVAWLTLTNASTAVATGDFPRPDRSPCDILISSQGWNALGNIPEFSLLRNQNIVATYSGRSEAPLKRQLEKPLGETNRIFSAVSEDQRFSEQGFLKITPRSRLPDAQLNLVLAFFPSDSFFGDDENTSHLDRAYFRDGPDGAGFRHRLLAGDMAFLFHRPTVNVHVNFAIELPSDLQAYLKANNLTVSMDSDSDSVLFDALPIRKALRKAKISPRYARSPFRGLTVGGKPGDTTVEVSLAFAIQSDSAVAEHTKFYAALVREIEMKMPFLLNPAIEKRPSLWQRLTGNAYVPLSPYLIDGNTVSVLTDIGYFKFKTERYQSRSYRIHKL